MISHGVQWPEDTIRVTELTQTEEKSARGRIEEKLTGSVMGRLRCQNLNERKIFNGGCKNN